MIPWLINEKTPFPPIEQALSTPNGLLAASHSISSGRLKTAYRLGIFPWYSQGEPVLWWSPSPRMVLYTENFKCHRSLKQCIHKGEYEIRIDSAFESVMRHCANTPREGQNGTWITEEIIRCYTALHHEGIAHSVESWHENRLVGGLYGICIGHMFFGESMFSHRTDSSKVALFHLVKRLSEHGLNMIDCQQETKHLKSLGAAPISRETFKAAIAERINRTTPLNLWQ